MRGGRAGGGGTIGDRDEKKSKRGEGIGENDGRWKRGVGLYNLFRRQRDAMPEGAR
jgi:hypothetical protein